MNRLAAGRALMTLVLAASTLLSLVLDWSPNHLLNPLWHPHARFHGALLLFLLAGVSATGIWWMWRQPGEVAVPVRAASFVSLSFWTPLFYITSILPGSTSLSGAPAKDPRVAGSLMTPNLIVAGLFVLLSVAGVWLSFGTRSRE